MSLIALLVPSLYAGTSLEQLVSANGVSVAVYDGEASSGAVLDRFSDHVFKQESPDVDEVRDLLYDAYFGARVDGSAGWLQSASSVDYVAGTNVIAIDRSTAELAITEYAFAPSDLSYPALVHLLHVENISGGSLSEVALFSLGNFMLGNDDDGDGLANDDEAIWMDGYTLTEWGNDTGLVMHVVPLVDPDAWTCDSLYTTVTDGDDLDSRCGTTSSTWTWDDQVGGFQWNVGPLASGDEAWVGVVWGFAADYDVDTTPTELNAWIDGRAPQDVLDDQTTWWSDWLDDGTPPDGLSADEEAVYEQSLVFLKSAQVTEMGATGQIVASLPGSSGGSTFDHTWNITWVRDSAYAIVALVEAGYTDEPRSALEFLIQDSKNGSYAEYLEDQDYAVSVCRAYGDGTEWSDDDGTGPNIELDNFGLILWAVNSYVETTGDDLFLSGYSEDIFGGVADVLVNLIEESGDAEGLLMADSSIWERHWDGNQKRFTYSNLTAVAGLRAAASLATRAGETGRAAAYTDAADRVAAALASKLVDGSGVLAGNLEELQAGSGYDDFAAVEAFNNGAIDPADPIAVATLEHLAASLTVASGLGYARNDDGSLYDTYEWPFIDLRAALAWRRACRPDEGAALEARVTSAARENHDTVPELYDPSTGDYAGPAPMLGFGAGAYVLQMINRADVDCVVDTGTPETGDPETGDPETGVPDDSAQPDDSAPPDDSSPTDDSAPPDDSATPDSADTAALDTANKLYNLDGGCCSTNSRSTDAGWWLLAGLLALRRRRGEVPRA